MTVRWVSARMGPPLLVFSIGVAGWTVEIVYTSLVSLHDPILFQFVAGAIPALLVGAGTGLLLLLGLSGFKMFPTWAD